MVLKPRLGVLASQCRKQWGCGKPINFTMGFIYDGVFHVVPGNVNKQLTCIMI